MLPQTAFNSPDLKPEDYSITLEMWQEYTRNVTTPKNAYGMLGMWYGLKQSVIDDALMMSVVNVPVHVFLQ